MVAHDAEGVELEAILFLALLDRIQQHFPTLQSGQTKFPIIAAYGEVIAIPGFQVTGWARRGHNL